MESLGGLFEKLPKSYREYILENGSTAINGFKIIGSPISILKATLALRKKRNDLPEALVVISLHPIVKGKVLCLDLRESHEEDCPLVETDLLKEGAPLVPVSDSFSNWLEQNRKRQNRFNLARLK